MSLDDLIEDVEWLLECRTWPPEIVQRVGYTSIDSLARRLQRGGRLDLAREFYPYEREEPKPARTTLPERKRTRRRVAPCGTDSGYRRHYYYGEPVCDACRQAHRDADREGARLRMRARRQRKQQQREQVAA